MHGPNTEHTRNLAGHAARVAAAATMASWFAWQLVLLRGHIPF
jgi:hypothetical protein